MNKFRSPKILFLFLTVIITASKDAMTNPIRLDDAVYNWETFDWTSVNPTVTELIVGSDTQDTDGKSFVFIPTVVYIESNGYKIIWDAGGVGQINDVLPAFKEKMALDATDIDMVITSHNHVDHYFSAYLFPTAAYNFDGFVVKGSKFTLNPLGMGKGEKYYVNDNKNLELIATDGHTLQDNSLIVRNVLDMGTVCLVGDTMLSEGDAMLVGKDLVGQDVEKLKASRLALVCMCDFIVPGHGPTFKVTDTIKKAVFDAAGVHKCP